MLEITDNNEDQLESTQNNEDQVVSIALQGYFRHYKFRLQEYLSNGVEEFDSSSIMMPLRTKIEIQKEINRIDMILTSHGNYKKSLS